MKLVVVESPLRGQVPPRCPRALAPFVERALRFRNHIYALACMRDSLARGEAPYASHVLFDQPGLLDDADPEQRELGMYAGFAWGDAADLRAVYCDHGISSGMQRGIDERPDGQEVEYRYLLPNPDRRDEERADT